ALMTQQRAYTTWEGMKEFTSYKAKVTRGPPKQHLPTGDPHVVNTEDLHQERMSYVIDEKRPATPQETSIVQRFTSPDAEVRLAAVNDMLEYLRTTKRISPSGIREVTNKIYDDDCRVRIAAGRTLQFMCQRERWGMDEWIARIADRLKSGEDDVTTQIHQMRALGLIGAYASAYSTAVSPFFDHEEPYVRLIAIETVGRLTEEVGRHKHSLVRLLREDPNMEVRKQADLVLKQRGWREPHWMKCQKPAWRDRVARAKANRGKGTTKGKKSEGKFGKIYWERVR
ncbi:unnamed protein product, partial [Effrenium voratum]